MGNAAAIRTCMMALALAALAAGCGGGGGGSESSAPPPPPPATVASITVSPASAAIDPAGTASFTAVARDAAGNEVPGVSFTWASSSTAVATVSGSVAIGVAPGTSLVSASAQGVTSAPATLTVRTPASSGAASSAELIAAALAAGAIDAETALAYRAYAIFKDARLPAAYRGDDNDLYDSGVMAEINARFDTLSEATQRLLVPFLLRPGDQGSWLDPNRTLGATVQGKTGRQAIRPDCVGALGSWRAIDPQTAKVRVWYDSDVAAHRAVALRVGELIELHVWPRLITSLGFKEPESDVSPVPCFGGNSKLDIYIVGAHTMSDRGQTIEGFSSVYQGSAHIRIRDNLDDEQLKHAVSHEFMHAVHWSYRTAATQMSYGWFRDALANWATDEVFPGNPSLNKQASCQFRSAHLALADESTGHCDGSSLTSRNYGSYLPLRFIAKTQGPLMIRSILEATTVKTSALEAIDSTVIGGLKEVWPQYAKRLWNDDPIPTLYPGQTFDAWDSLAGVATRVPKPQAVRRLDGNLGGAVQLETQLDAELNNVSARYYHFTFTEVATRSLMFHNTFYDFWKAGKAVKVQALLKPEGRPWIEEDWTEYEWIGLCRDAKEQRVSDIIVIVSSAEWRGSAPAISAAEPPTMKRNVIGCWGYAGHTTRQYVDGNWSGGGSIGNTVDVRFDYLPGGRPNQFNDPANGRLRVPITAPLYRSGNWTLTERYTSGGCTHTTNASGTDSSVALGGDAAGEIIINNFIESLPLELRNDQVVLVGSNQPGAYLASGISSAQATGSVTGPQPPCGTSYETALASWLFTRGERPNPIQIAGDGHLRGSFALEQAGDNFTDHYTWDLAPLREP
jgi:hypothetical protein